MKLAAQFPISSTTVKTTCPYCGVGCGVSAQIGQDGAVAIAGDAAHPASQGRLCVKGSALGETLGNRGRLARIGGEEFAVLTDATHLTAVEVLIECLREATPFGQTVSAGIAVWDGLEPADAAMRRADDALYAAKHLGRDRCVVAPHVFVSS